jgi:1-acyl-sn-glycerol-3-phosphate acyltransferase
MAKLISFILTPIYLLAFGLLLVIFHPIQWLGLKVFGYAGHKKAVDAMNFCLMQASLLLGNTHSFSQAQAYPPDRPLILVSNHQSMYDISPLQWYLRKHHPKFVSKIELGKGIPSVSFNLKHGGSVLIDRKDRKQSITQLIKMGKYIEEHRRSVVIFPEGTRSKTGQPRDWKTVGLKMLLKASPSALIVPVTVNNSWKVLKYGKFPYGIGVHLQVHAHKALERTDDIDAFLAEVAQQVNSQIKI